MPAKEYDNDLTISYVLYHTKIDEVEQAIRQALSENNLSVRLVIVDNSVPSLLLPKWILDSAEIIRNERNIGYGAAHNLAFQRVGPSAKYHIVMNTDVTYAPGTLTDMIHFMNSHPHAGLAMPKVKYPDGQIQTVCRLLPAPWDLIGKRFFSYTQWGRNRACAYELRDWDYDGIASIPFLSGCFMMIKFEILEAVGGFDERFFLYAEDLDLSRRIYSASDALFNPDATIVHEYRGRYGFNMLRLLRLVVNLSRYFNKWGWIFDKERKRINLKTLERLNIKDASG